MIKLKCNNCGKEMMVQGVVGTIPLQIPMNNYCSDKCLNEAHEKSKS